MTAHPSDLLAAMGLGAALGAGLSWWLDALAAGVIAARAIVNPF